MNFNATYGVRLNTMIAILYCAMYWKYARDKSTGSSPNILPCSLDIEPRIAMTMIVETNNNMKLITVVQPKKVVTASKEFTVDISS